MKLAGQLRARPPTRPGRGDRSREEHDRDRLRELRDRRTGAERRSGDRKLPSPIRDGAEERDGLTPCFSDPFTPGALELLRESDAFRIVGRRGLRRLAAGCESVRSRAWALRDAGRQAQPARSLARCGWTPVGQVALTRRREDLGGGATLASVHHCHSVHGCPVCAMAIKGRRAQEVTALVQLWRQHFGPRSVLMQTLTFRHSIHDRLDELEDGFAEARERFERCRSRDALEAREGLVGRAVAKEVTHGANGWHLHSHGLLFFERSISAGEVAEIQRSEAQRWAETVARTMGEDHRPTLERGCDVRPAELADYIAKLGLELSDVGTKEAKRGGLTPWGILERAAHGERRSRGRWAEYVRATKGRSSVRFGQNLLKRARLLGYQHKEDGELTDESTGAAPFLEVPRAAWRELRISGRLGWALQGATDAEITERVRSLTSPGAWEEPTPGIIEGIAEHDRQIRAEHEAHKAAGARGLLRAERRALASLERTQWKLAVRDATVRREKASASPTSWQTWQQLRDHLAAQLAPIDAERFT